MKQYQKNYGAVIAMLLAICICSACSEETNTTPGASQFAKEITAEKYKATAPPSADPVFRWDFSKAQVVHAYAFEQEVRSKTDLGSSMGQEISARGLLLVKSQGDNTAELVLKDMKMSMKLKMGEGDPRTMEQQMPQKEPGRWQHLLKK